MSNEHRRTVGFLGWSAAYLAFTSQTAEESQLKVATVFYDQLILPVLQHHLDGILRHFCSDERIDSEGPTEAWLSVDRVAPGIEPRRLFHQLVMHDDENCWDNTGNLRPGLREAVDEAMAEFYGVTMDRLRQIESENRYGYIREANAIAASATGGARVWSWLQPHIECALLAFNRAEAVAARHLLDSASVAQGGSLRDAVEAYVPSVRQLSWDAVFALRRDPRVTAFRRWLSEAALAPDSKSDTALRAIDHLWSAVKDLRTDTKTELLKGLAGNLILPIPVNPFSVGLAAKAVIDARRFEKKYGWLLFLHSIHDATRA